MDSPTPKSINRPQVSIGLPVYNGEKFIRKRLESILSQTFTDFELIISDNASTDSTSLICKEYAKKDKRIRYIRQEKNMGITWNYNFVLQESKCNYFMWAAVDDIILPTFLEKNVNILMSNENVVGSISKIMAYGEMAEGLRMDIGDSIVKKIIKKIKLHFSSVGVHAAFGPFEKKVRSYLKKRGFSHAIFGVYRTDKLRKSLVHDSFIGNDWAIILNVLKYGDLHVIDEDLMRVYDAGLSRKGAINLSRQFNHGVFQTIFPFYPFTVWCLKHLGVKLFLKNLDCFIRINCGGEFSLIVDLFRILKRSMIQK